MVKKEFNELYVCTDCTPVLANGDYSALGYYYDPNTAAQRSLEINQGVNELGPAVFPGDSIHDIEFSKQPCECCGSNLYGSRHLFLQEVLIN